MTDPENWPPAERVTFAFDNRDVCDCGEVIEDGEGVRCADGITRCVECGESMEERGET